MSFCTIKQPGTSSAMNNTKELKHQVRQLESRIEFLEEQKRFTLDLLEAASSLGDFQTAIGRLQDPSIILQETASRIQQLLSMRTQAIYLVDERDSDFKPAFCSPAEDSEFVAENLAHLIDKGIFAWALREKRPVFISGKDGVSRFVLHALATSSRVRGMYLGVLSDKPGEVYDYSLALLSILLANSANALESFELYKWINKINQDLEQKVRALATSEQELKRHRYHLQELVGERTVELNKVVDRLKDSVREKDILHKEVHQRVTGNLQAIMGLLSLQSERAGDDVVRGALGESQARVRALCLIQESLYRAGNIANVEFQPYLASLTQELLQSLASGRADIELGLDAQNVTLGMDQAVSCGLIVNELLANCLGHAFPGGRSGRIGVGLRLRGAECSLFVEDDGVGLSLGSESREPQSLGFQFVRSLAAQLGGRLDFTRLDPGTRVSVTFSPCGTQSGALPV
ncbi:sensor histidine kinase [Desulfocurvibacter africanus]|uniref:sensor histidine kinase n=1 Tax=Desulfocurvibacter africanus TaxID=873 RepID=UPI001FCC2609|nr:histidine kinase dimerization/phosphoacceptor domain -containing protein [Desulfocurvibacter africanus]